MTRRPEDRAILRLAWPAFLALVAEPLFVLADAAVVGHLGTTQLAAAGVAGALMTTLVGLCIFLAYGTTSSVARSIGAGHTDRALAHGVDGLWLAVAIGMPVSAASWMLAPRLVDLLGASAVAGPAATYLRIALVGTTPLLLMLAATGVLRGLQDTRTPLLAAVAGNVLNVALNVGLVYGIGPVDGLGLPGSALGSVLAQVATATFLVGVVARAALRAGVDLAPHPRGVLAAGRAGVPLVVRTLTLRAAILLTVYAVAALPETDGGGEHGLAAHQVAMAVWGFLAYALDAIAIAAQAITGRALGSGDLATTRRLTTRMLQWGVAAGVVTGLGLAAAAPWLGRLFTRDRTVDDLLVPVLLVAALAQPLAGVVFVLDGVLIGAGDGRYLAWAGTLVLAAYAPLALLAPSLTWLWAAFGFGFMAARAAVLLHRARGTRWMRTGTTLTR
ncbi:MATE family efflux transporter [Nocardioides jiangxiensis]|uniref:MATE family efflux transporter n=1 Tax=Nocardioides jiangxiensis TaxID=3064524 RepID=A0ABT9B1J2_9ACTN|nr:MATE family efflux transporter [Nocardioides sp. WY-20]MDO7868184.1 MATE family efflux transporter [Nocardioides sp. WY-20]